MTARPAIPVTPTAATDAGRRAAAALAAALVVLLAAAAAAQSRPITVSYLSASTVYVDAGRADGLVEGATLRVVRGGERIAELEVDYVAEHSASCRVTTLVQGIRQGDAVVIVALPPGAGEAPSPVLAPPAPEPVAPPALPALEPEPEPAARTRAYGSLAVGWRGSSDAAGGPSTTEATERLSLRLSELGGKPLELRARLRGRQLTREGYADGVATDESSNRLYELSLAYEPPAGRFSFRLGRLGAGPYVALGYLDGALAQLRLTRRLYVGAFGGTRPDLVELELDTAGTKYGGFLRFASAGGWEDRYAEVVVGGVTERSDTGEVDRDYLTIESRFGSGWRWSLFQRAEIDLNRGWRREAADSSSQISNAALAASVALSESWRASLSYDQRRDFLTLDTRPAPEEVFTRYFREGARLALDWQDRSGWSVSAGAGQERAEEIDEPTTSALLSIFRANAFGTPLMLGADGSWYTGGTVEGWVASLRSRWAFRGGHDLGLTVGGSSSQLAPVAGLDGLPPTVLPARENQWVRLSGTLQLPRRLYLFGEYEQATGDDFEGDRFLAELGYRF